MVARLFAKVTKFTQPITPKTVVLALSQPLLGECLSDPGFYPTFMIIELTETGNDLLGFGHCLFTQSSIETNSQIFKGGNKRSQNVVAVTVTPHMHTLGMKIMILAVLGSS